MCAASSANTAANIPSEIFSVFHQPPLIGLAAGEGREVFGRPVDPVDRSVIVFFTFTFVAVVVTGAVFAVFIAVVA